MTAARPALSRTDLALIDDLPATERDLIRNALVRDIPLGELARAAGVQRWTLQRRLIRILKRLRDPAFAFIAVHHPLWPEPRSRIAQLIWLHNESRAAVARRLKLSPYRIRKEVEAIRAQFEQHQATRTRSHYAA